MKVTKRNGSKERKILIGMIVDSQVLGRIASKWESNLFKSSWGNLVGQWCVDFYLEYESAPKQEIESLFESWASKTHDEESVELIDKFLSGLSEEYEAQAEASNSNYIIDLASEYFNKVKLRSLSESIKGDLIEGDVQSALVLQDVSAWKKITAHWPLNGLNQRIVKFVPLTKPNRCHI